MTGKHVEKLLNKPPLQWVVVCLLHANELTLHHVSTMFDGTNKSGDSFSIPIEKLRSGGDVSSWPVAANFKSIPNPHFIKLPESVIADSSADQHYACNICSAIMSKELFTVTCYI